MPPLFSTVLRAPRNTVLGRAGGRRDLQSTDFGLAFQSPFVSKAYVNEDPEHR